MLKFLKLDKKNKEVEVTITLPYAGDDPTEAEKISIHTPEVMAFVLAEGYTVVDIVKSGVVFNYRKDKCEGKWVFKVNLPEEKEKPAAKKTTKKKTEKSTFIAHPISDIIILPKHIHPGFTGSADFGKSNG